MGKPKANIEKLNKDLQKLYELLCEVKSNTPDMELSNEWDDVFGGVDDLIDYMDDVSGTSDGFVPSLNDVEIIFEAAGTSEDLDVLYDNLDNEYPMFKNDVERETAEEKNNVDDKMNKYFKCHFYGVWIGDTDDLIRLTHHAEALYKDTGMEYVHVEVCLNGEWYGRG